MTKWSNFYDVSKGVHVFCVFLTDLYGVYNDTDVCTCLCSYQYWSFPYFISIPKSNPFHRLPFTSWVFWWGGVGGGLHSGRTKFLGDGQVNFFAYICCLIVYSYISSWVYFSTFKFCFSLANKTDCCSTTGRFKRLSSDWLEH